MIKRIDCEQTGSKRRETYPVEDLTKMAEKLDTLPDAGGRRQLSRPGALKFLAPQIEDLRKKGYTTREICEALADVGLRITPHQFVKLMPISKSAARGKIGASEYSPKAGPRPRRVSQAGASKPAQRDDKRKSKGTIGELAGFSVKPDRLEI